MGDDTGRIDAHQLVDVSVEEHSHEVDYTTRVVRGMAKPAACQRYGT